MKCVCGYEKLGSGCTDKDGWVLDRDPENKPFISIEIKIIPFWSPAKHRWIDEQELNACPRCGTVKFPIPELE